MLKLWICIFSNLNKNNGKNISKNLNVKCSQRHLDHGKQSATDVLKTNSKIMVPKTANAAGDLIGNKLQKKTEVKQKMQSLKKQ